MRIGELASRNAVSTATVRYYEEIGLIDPPPRTASGYRNYDEDASSIRAAQSAGLSLDDIHTILEISKEGDAPCGHVAELIDAKVETIAVKIAALKAAKAELETLSARARALAKTPCPDGSICHILAP